MQVSHLHPKQQRLVAHHMLIHANDPDAVEQGRVVDQHPPSFGKDRAVGGVPRHAQALGLNRPGMSGDSLVCLP